MVVCFSLVVAQKFHRITFGYMLWMLLHERLDTVPQGRNGLDVFVQTQHEAVLLAMISHILERIVADVAVQLDAGFDPPIPLELLHQRMLEEEARFKSTHMPITDRVSVNDLPRRHILADPARLVLIDVIWERPMFRGYFTVMRLARYQGCRYSFEGLIKRFIVQENPVVVVVPIKAILDLPDRFDDLPQIRVSCQRDKGGIRPFAALVFSRVC